MRARTLLLTITRALLTVTGTLLLAVTRLLTAGAEITVLVTVTLVVVAVFVALLVEVLTIAHNGRMRDDTRAKADGEDSGGCSGDSRALAPRGLLRRRLTHLRSGCHGLVTLLFVGRRPRNRLQRHTSKRIGALLMSDGRHLRRFYLRHVGGENLCLLCCLLTRPGQNRGALRVTHQVLVDVRHEGRSFLFINASLPRSLETTHEGTLWRNCEQPMNV